MVLIGRIAKPPRRVRTRDARRLTAFGLCWRTHRGVERWTRCRARGAVARRVLALREGDAVILRGRSRGVIFYVVEAAPAVAFTFRARLVQVKADAA